MKRSILIVAATLLTTGCGGSQREQEGAAFAGVAAALTTVQIVRAGSLQVQPTKENCTHFCTSCTFPCGDHCLSYGSMCIEPPGKACWAKDMPTNDKPLNQVGICPDSPDLDQGIFDPLIGGMIEGIFAPLIGTSQ